MVADLDRLAEAGDQLGFVRKGDAEHLVLGHEPAGAEAELEAAAGDVVDRDRLLGQQRRVAEGVAGDQDAEADALRGQSQPSQQRPGLEDRAVQLERRHVVIGQPEAVEADRSSHAHCSTISGHGRCVGVCTPTSIPSATSFPSDCPPVFRSSCQPGA